MSQTTPLVGRFNKLLIANRGEIACRIARTANRMGIRTVAVFSEADRHAMHVSICDEAVCIGPPEASKSYLNIESIIGAAKKTQAGGIHPGYGFLSENGAFAAACQNAGLIFVGPSPDVIRAMASKSAAKDLMARSGVPLVPGFHGAEQDIATLTNAAAEIGYPVLVKASAGGGGRGMRIVASPEDLPDAVAGAKREAASAFGDDHVLIEKYIQNPRHIEVQVFGDVYGNIVSLFERECTLQRRHQKVLEEAPSPTLTDQSRDAIYQAARAAAAAVGYTGAGTVEFVADAQVFYFIEMNTRLQVEHPVTEMITGLDLVEWQLRVAFGEPLPKTQSEIERKGHAIEVRVCAEDPEAGFLPSGGRLGEWVLPELNEHIRIDRGFREGDVVSPHYDSMLGKIIAGGADRSQALERLSSVLNSFDIAGIKTNVAFLAALVGRPEVHANRIDTGFIGRELTSLLAHASSVSELDLAAAVGALLAREAKALSSSTDPWGVGDGWTILGRRKRQLKFEGAGVLHEATLIYERDGSLLDVAAQAAPFSFRVRDDGKLDVFFGDTKQTVSVGSKGDAFLLLTPRGRVSLRLISPLSEMDESTDAASGIIQAPMPGVVRQVFASAGDRLKRGDVVLILEAMKMEHSLTAPGDGVLASLRCAVGDYVEPGESLAEFEADHE